MRDAWSSKVSSALHYSMRMILLKRRLRAQHDWAAERSERGKQAVLSTYGYAVDFCGYAMELESERG